MGLASLLSCRSFLSLPGPSTLPDHCSWRPRLFVLPGPVNIPGPSICVLMSERESGEQSRTELCGAELQRPTGCCRRGSCPAKTYSGQARRARGPQAGPPSTGPANALLPPNQTSEGNAEKGLSFHVPSVQIFHPKILCIVRVSSLSANLV